MTSVAGQDRVIGEDEPSAGLKPSFGSGQIAGEPSKSMTGTANGVEGSKVIGFTEIKEKYLPHRYPIIMLDRITDYQIGDYIEAIKCVTGNSPELVGHFPERAILPATFIIQALAQLAIVFLQLSRGPLKKDEMTVITTTRFKFFRPVFPGDTLKLTLRPTHFDDSVGIFSGNAHVEKKSVVRGSMTLAKTKISKFANPLW
jgi:3-hydroxyacyl-[acyl-carrier-protein] dehydratase